MKPNLKIIKTTHRPAVVEEGPPADITALLHADIAKRDWPSVHVAADKREPVDIAETRLRRTWR